MTLTIQKIARDRQNTYSLGIEKAIHDHVPAEQQDEFRTIIKSACAGAAELRKVLDGGDERRANQIKVAFAQLGVSLEGNEMTNEERQAKLAEAVKDGLTAKKIANDRQNVFEMGVDAFIEQAGLNDEDADNFRKIAAEGLAELNEHPEVVKEFLKA